MVSHFLSFRQTSYPTWLGSANIVGAPSPEWSASVTPSEMTHWLTGKPVPTNKSHSDEARLDSSSSTMKTASGLLLSPLGFRMGHTATYMLGQREVVVVLELRIAYLAGHSTQSSREEVLLHCTSRHWLEMAPLCRNPEVYLLRNGIMPPMVLGRSKVCINNPVL